MSEPAPEIDKLIRIKIKRDTASKLRLIKSYYELKNYDAAIRSILDQNQRYREELDKLKKGAKTGGLDSVLPTDNSEPKNYNSQLKITTTIEDNHFDINRPPKLPRIDLRDGWQN